MINYKKRVTHKQLLDAERRGLTLNEFLEELGVIALSIEEDGIYGNEDEFER